MSLPKLETKHFAWILESAAEAFEQKARETEIEIMRHDRFYGEPIATPHVSRTQSRAEKIASLHEFLLQYRDILTVLRAMRERVADITAEEFARDFAAFTAPKPKS